MQRLADGVERGCGFRVFGSQRLLFDGEGALVVAQGLVVLALAMQRLAGFVEEV